jgi:hypothetical protein
VKIFSTPQTLILQSRPLMPNEELFSLTSAQRLVFFKNKTLVFLPTGRLSEVAAVEWQLTFQTL